MLRRLITAALALLALGGAAHAQLAGSPPGINGPPVPVFFSACPTASTLPCVGNQANPLYATVNQGNPNTAPNAWPFYLTQGGAAVSSSNPTFVQLTPGSALAGKFGIDQTTPGTTNGVVDTALETNLGTGADTPVQTAGATGTLLAQVKGVLVRILAVQAAPGSSPTTAESVQGAAGGVPIAAVEQGSALAGVGITPVVVASGTSAVGKASQGNLYSAYALVPTAPAAQQYLVLINAAAPPASGAAIAPVDFAPFSAATTANASASINYGAGPPDAYSAGIVALITTSLTTYTPGTASLINVRTR